MDIYNGMGMNTGMDWGFTIIPIIVVLGFIFVFVMMAVSMAQGVKQWNKNNKSPVLTVDATVVTKRGDVSHHHNHGTDHMDYTTSSTTYYVTFEVESKDRMEFLVSGEEYGMLVEGDHGRLTFQGIRYQGFVRK